MLNIFIDKYSDKVWSSFAEDFDILYLDVWFSDPLVIEIVRDIDNCEVISSQLITSPILGSMSPTFLSSGCKFLIMCLHYEDIIDPDECVVFDGDRFGDNCIPWLFKIVSNKDVNIWTNRVLALHEYVMPNLRLLPAGVIVTNPEEYAIHVIKNRWRG